MRTEPYPNGSYPQFAMHSASYLNEPNSTFAPRPGAEAIGDILKLGPDDRSNNMDAELATSNNTTQLQGRHQPSYGAGQYIPPQDGTTLAERGKDVAHKRKMTRRSKGAQTELEPKHRQSKNPVLSFSRSIGPLKPEKPSAGDKSRT